MLELHGDDLLSLTPDELHRVHRTLTRRFRNFDHGNIVGLAFGIKQRGGRRLRHQGLTLRFFVKKKRRPRAEKDRIPPEVRVRLQRKSYRRRVVVVFKSDVEKVGRIRPTGVRVSVPSEFATAGVVIRNRRPGQIGNHPSAFVWRVVSVAHLVRSLSLPAKVKLAQRKPAPATIDAVVRIRAGISEKFDVALCEAAHNDLQQANLLVTSTTTLTIRSHTDLQADALVDPKGKIFRRPDQQGVGKFKLTDYSPDMPISSLGSIRNVIRAEADSGTFIPGTSGAVWQVNGQLAAIQIAAEDGGAVGYAQALFSILEDWAASRCNGVPEVQAAF